MENPGTHALTIAICTYNRAELLRDCLNSIANQPSVEIAWSVLVVDNNSNDETKEVCKEFAEKLSNFRSVIELESGASNARNRAIAECKTEWIAFIDDDAMVAENWILIAEEEINLNRFDAFGGPYDAWHRYGPPPHWFDPKWECNFPNHITGEVLKEGVPTGGNSVVKMSWAKKIRFDSAVGPRNLNKLQSNVAYGEDTQFFVRIREAGGLLGWRNDLLIHHCVRPIKYQKLWRIRSYFQRGVGSKASPLPGSKRRRILYHCKMSLILFFKFVQNGVKSQFKKPREPLWRAFFNCGGDWIVNAGQLVGELKLLFPKAVDEAPPRSPRSGEQ